MDAYRVHVKRPIDFLDVVFTCYAGESLVSFEGDLTVLRNGHMPGLSEAETACLRRQTVEPQEDFLVAPLTREALPALQAMCRRAGVRNRITHIEIEHDGELVFSACDQFDPAGVWLSTRLERTTLDQLRDRGVIASYARVNDVA